MRRLFIIRKDLHLTPGKLAAMVAHCSEGYWTNLINHNASEIDGKITTSFEIDKDIFEEYLNGSFTKTICEAKNLYQLLKAKDLAMKLGLEQDKDFGIIEDCCKTELTPEFVDEEGIGYCTVGIWFKPLSDDMAHLISKKYQLYKS